MTEFKSIDDFLNHKGNSSGDGKRLGNDWKDKGYCNAWMHTKQFPTAVYFHRIPELVVRKDRDDPSITKRNIWGRQFVCYEDESILKKQRFRTPEGHREHPPVACPICRLIECVREMVIDGRLADTDTIFDFSGSDKPDENIALIAGAFTSMWKRDLEPSEKQRLTAAGVYMSEAWKQNMVAKLNYIFAMVDNDDLEKGLVVAIQTQLLGDKVKREINKQIASNGETGNPFLHPYVLQFQYKPNEKKFDDKYDAARMNKFPMTDAVKELITGEKPDISRFTRKPDLKELRAMLEARCKVELPWDSIFDVPAYHEAAGVDFDSANKTAPAAKPQAAPTPPRVAPAAAPAASPAPAGRTRVQAAPAPAAALPMGDPCDDCHRPMHKGQLKCECGAVYEDDAAPAPADTKPSVVAASSSEDAVYDADIPF